MLKFVSYWLSILKSSFRVLCFLCLWSLLASQMLQPPLFSQKWDGLVLLPSLTFFKWFNPIHLCWDGFLNVLLINKNKWGKQRTRTPYLNTICLANNACTLTGLLSILTSFTVMRVTTSFTLCVMISGESGTRTHTSITPIVFKTTTHRPTWLTSPIKSSENCAYK